MKTFATFLAASALLTFGALGQGFTPTGRNVKIEKINAAATKTPEFTVRNTTEKRVKPLDWVEVEVEFSIDLPKGVEMIDELTFDYLVEINGKLCPGEVTHVNITNGKDHFSIMYISPRGLERLAPGKPVNNSTIGNVWVEIKKQGQLLAKKSLTPGEPKNLPRQTGLLVQKSETPFHPLWWDRYEATRASTGSR